MAKKKNEELTGPQKLAAKGFSDAGAGDNAAWVRLKEDAVWVGILMGRFEMRKVGRDGKKRAYFQLRVTQSPFVDDAGKQHPCMGIKRDPETDEFGDDVIPLNPGDLVNIDSRAKLEWTLTPLVNDGKRYEVVVHALAKKPIKGSDNTPWDFDVKKRLISEDEDIPF